MREEQIPREEVMRSLTLTVAAAAALLSADSVANRASAMMFASPAGIRAVIESLNVTENVQYVYGGRGYCWYDYGWNGPGWDWCGYAYRRGFIVGGGGGFFGWCFCERGWGAGGPLGGEGVGDQLGRVLVL